MSDETSAPVPPGWVRLTLENGHVDEADVRPDEIRLIARGEDRAEGDDRERGAMVWLAGDSAPTPVSETPAEIKAQIAAAQRAQRRFDALPAMAAIVLCPPKMGLVDPRQRYYEAADDALAILDAIEAREAGR